MAIKETGIQLLARLGKRPSVSGIEPHLFGDGPYGRDVIELYGEEGTGKSETLQHLIARCIMPEYWNNVHLKGHGAGVILIDLDMKFSIMKLAQLLESFVLQKLSASNSQDSNRIDSDAIEPFISDCLKNLHIIRCKDSSEFLLTLHNLENTICNDPNISVLMIDSISAFYWMDRMENGDNIAAYENHMRLSSEVVSKLVNTYSLVLVASKAALFRKKGQENESEICDEKLISEDLALLHSEILCKAWQRLVTHRIVLAREKTSKEGDQSFVAGGDCASGNTRFSVTSSGIVFA